MYERFLFFVWNIFMNFENYQNVFMNLENYQNVFMSYKL